MRWMEKRADERGDIDKYYPEAKSIIPLGLTILPEMLHPTRMLAKFPTMHGEMITMI